MPVSPVCEATLGVADLGARVRQLEAGLGLSVLASGLPDSMTSSRLFEVHTPPRVCLMGRPDVAGSPRLRLVEIASSNVDRSQSVVGPGPVGIGFLAEDMTDVHSRLSDLGVRFVSPPLEGATVVQAAASVASPLELAALGRCADGDFLALLRKRGNHVRPGSPDSDRCSPAQALFTVTNVDACLHFMRDVLEHEAQTPVSCSGAPFDGLTGQDISVSFIYSLAVRSASPAMATGFIQFESRPEPMIQTPALAPGLCRLRFDTTDLHATLARVPGGGGALVRGPAGVDDPILGSGLMALVRSPFGVVIELWQSENGLS